MACTSDVKVANKIRKPATVKNRKSSPSSSSLLITSGIFGSASPCSGANDHGGGSSGVNRRRCRKASVVMHLTPDIPNDLGEAKKRRTSPIVGSCVNSHDECPLLPPGSVSNAEEVPASMSNAKCWPGMTDCATGGSLDADEVHSVCATKEKRTTASLLLRPTPDRAVGVETNGVGMKLVEGSAKEDAKRNADKYDATEDDTDDKKAVDCGTLAVGDSVSTAALCTSAVTSSKCAQLLGRCHGNRRTFHSPGVERLLGAGAMHDSERGGTSAPPGFYCYLCLLDEERAAAERTSDEEEEEEEEEAAAVGTDRRPRQHLPSSSPLGSLWELMDHVSVVHMTSEMLDDGGGRSKLTCPHCRSRFVVVDGVEDGYIRTVYHAHEMHGWPLPGYMKDAVRCHRCGCVLVDAHSLRLHQCTTHEVPRYEQLVKPERIETAGGSEPRLVGGRLRPPHGAVKCPACGMIRHNRVALSSHVRMYHSQGGEGLFTCPLCSCTMLLSAVFEHMRRKHGDRRLQKVPASGTGESDVRQSSSSADVADDAPPVKLEIDGDRLPAARALLHADGLGVSNREIDSGIVSSVSATLPLSGKSMPDVGSGFVPIKAETDTECAPSNQPPAQKLQKTVSALGRRASSLLSPSASVAAGRSAAAAAAAVASASASTGSRSSSSSSIGLLSDERLMCSRCCKRILGAANLARHMEVIHGTVGDKQ